MKDFFDNKTDEERLLEELENNLRLIGKSDIYLLETIVNEVLMEDLLEETLKRDIKTSVRTAKDKATLAKRTTSHKIEKTGEHIDTLIQQARQAVIGKSRDEIMTNHTKVSTIIKKILTTGAVYAVTGGACTLLYLFVTNSLRKKLTRREQEKILADLKMELEICEEKINDATNSGDKKAKYELMRLRNSLKRNIIRIQNAGRGIRNIG